MSFLGDLAIPHVYCFRDGAWQEQRAVGLQMFECPECLALTLDFKGHVKAAHGYTVERPESHD